MKSFLQTSLRALLIATAFSYQAIAAEYIVKYKNALTVMSNVSTDVQVMDHHAAGQYYMVDIPESKKIEGLLQLTSNPNVAYVVPNFKMHSFTTPVVASSLQSQWAIEKVQAEKAWQRAGNKGSKKVIVAVIDTGADYKHKNLAPNMITGYNFINSNNDPMDITGQNPGHGTHCSGIIGATGLVDGGTIGISPEVSIMPLRFLDENGSGDLNNSIKAIDYAIQQHVSVISASWGAAVSNAEAQPLIEAIGRAEKAGIVFVVAASNDGQNNDSYEVYPANAGLSNTISVAASSSNDSKPSWSNWGRGKVNLASPGDGIVSTLPGDKYGDLSGTSMATPLVAGLVALVKAQDSNLTPLQIRSLLQVTADKVGIETACDCRVNAYTAVDAVISKKMFISPYAGTYAVGAKVQFEAVYGKAPFSFSSSNTAVATIDNNGQLTAVANGETEISVKDAAGNTAVSYKINVGAAAPSQPSQPSQPQDPGQPGQDPGQDPGQPGLPGGGCPSGQEQLCQILCQSQPTLPFCKH